MMHSHLYPFSHKSVNPPINTNLHEFFDVQGKFARIFKNAFSVRFRQIRVSPALRAGASVRVRVFTVNPREPRLILAFSRAKMFQ